MLVADPKPLDNASGAYVDCRLNHSPSVGFTTGVLGPQPGRRLPWSAVPISRSTSHGG